jgi:hypothetical protein
MTSREFETQALLQAHALVVKDFLSEHSAEEEISFHTADQLAANAGQLAKRLTVEWENGVVWSQQNDLRIKEGTSDSNRQCSTTDLLEPFEPVEFVCRDGAQDGASTAELAALLDLQLTTKKFFQ